MMEDKGIPMSEMLDKELLDKIMQPTPMRISYPDHLTNSQQVAEIQEAVDERNRYNAKKDAAIFQAAEESKKQNELLSEQIGALKEQNMLLKEMYDGAKVEAAENKKQARHSQIFGWISFAVGTAIGIAGILVGFFI